MNVTNFSILLPQRHGVTLPYNPWGEAFSTLMVMLIFMFFIAMMSKEIAEEIEKRKAKRLKSDAG